MYQERPWKVSSVCMVLTIPLIECWQINRDMKLEPHTKFVQWCEILLLIFCFLNSKSYTNNYHTQGLFWSVQSLSAWLRLGSRGSSPGALAKWGGCSGRNVSCDLCPFWDLEGGGGWPIALLAHNIAQGHPMSQ